MKRESQKGMWHVVGDLIYTNKFTYTSVIPGRDYYFRVVAKNYLGSSRPSDTAQPWRIRKQKGKMLLQIAICVMLLLCCVPCFYHTGIGPSSSCKHLVAQNESA